MPRPNIIHAECVRAGITVAELAERCGVSRQTMYRVAQGRTEVWPRLRADMVDALGVPASRLFPAPRITDPVS